MRKALLLIFITLSFLYADDSKLYNKEDVNSSVISNLPSATNDKNVSNWNMADWKQYFSKIPSPGNTQALFGGSVGENAFSGNPNQLTDKYVSENLGNIKSMGAWTKDLKEKIQLNTFNNPVIQASGAKEIKCYITREIAFQYRCLATGVVYGGDIDKNGAEARRECEANCYEQKNCVMVGQQENNITKENIICEKGKNCSFSYPLFSDRTLKKIKIYFENSSPGAKLSLFLNSQEGIKTILDGYEITSSDLNMTLFANIPAKSANLVINNPTDKNIIISKIVFEYQSSGSYICPYLQDISNINGGDFAYVCPSGRTHTFYVGGLKYTICLDSNVKGDNPDGSFSSLEKCESVCRVSSDCVLDTKMFSTELLKTFREGCIAGQANCTDTDCKIARLSGDPIVEEVVYDATNKPTITVRDGVVVKDVYRPKIAIDDDLDYLQRAKEEWKDIAFKDMVKNRKYAVTKYAFGENTPSQSAYNYEIVDGADYGYPQKLVRTLYWLLKPRAFDVYSGKKFYLYSVFVVDVGYMDYNENGEKEKKRKIIWYLRTSKNDTFKPMRIKLDAGNTIIDNNTTYFMENQTSKYKSETFVNNMWITLPTTDYAEYFDTTYFDLPRLYWKFPVINNTGDFVYKLPGLVRRIKVSQNGLYVTKYYTGAFDGSGDGVLNYKIYTIYSPNLLTYADIFNLIDNKEITPIYSLNNSKSYPRTLPADSVSVKDIHIYQYGTIDKTTIMVRIRPDKQDVGKKGFIYVFIK